MKFLIISDIHFGKKDFPKREDIFNDFFVFVEGVLKTREKERPYVIIPGDIMADAKVDIDVLKKIHEFFCLISKYSGAIYVIPGNHDVMYNGTALGVFNGLKGKVFVYDSPRIVRLHDMKFVFVPYMIDRKEYFSIVEDNVGSSSILITHCGVEGFKITKDYVDIGGINRKILKKYKFAILGHIHNPSFTGNILIPGSPFYFSSSDSGERGIHLVEIEDDIKVEFLQYCSPRVLRVDIDDIEKHSKNFLIVRSNRELSSKDMERLKKIEGRYKIVFDTEKIIYDIGKIEIPDIVKNVKYAVKKYVDKNCKVPKKKKILTEFGLELLRRNNVI